MAPLRWVHAAVEGAVDEAVARKVIAFSGHGVAAIHVLGGKPELDARIDGYNHAALRFPWLVLRDFDRDAPCPPALVGRLLPSPASSMCFRIAVRSIESWILADADGFAREFSVSRAKIPRDPDSEADPKATLVALCMGSRLRPVRSAMCPRPGVSSRVGPGYNGFLVSFVQDRWNPAAAAERSPSLGRCLDSLRAVSAPVHPDRQERHD
jgi:hypothetical protein